MKRVPKEVKVSKMDHVPKKTSPQSEEKKSTEKINHFKLQLEGSNNLVKELEAEIHDIKKERDNAIKINSDGQEQIRALEATLNEMRQEINSLSEDFRMEKIKLCDRIKSNEENLCRKDSELKNASEIIEDHLMRLQNLTQENCQLQERISGLMQSNESMKSEVSTFQHKVQEYAMKELELRKEFEQAELKTKNTVDGIAVEKELKALQYKVQEYALKELELRKELEEAKLKTQNTVDLISVKEELKTLQHKVQEYAMKELELRKEIEAELKMQNTVDLISVEEELKKQISDHLTSLREKDTRIKTLETEFASLRKQYEEQICALEETLNEMHREIDSLSEDFRMEKIKLCDRIKSNEENLCRKDSELKNASEIIEDHLKSLQNLTQENCQLQVRISELLQSNESMKNEVSTLQLKVQELELRKELQEAELESQNTVLISVVEKLKTLQHKVQEYAMKELELRKELGEEEELKKQINDHLTRLRQKDTCIEYLETEFASLTKQHEVEIQEIKGDLSKGLSELPDVDETISSLRESVFLYKEKANLSCMLLDLEKNRSQQLEYDLEECNREVLRLKTEVKMNEKENNCLKRELKFKEKKNLERSLYIQLLEKRIDVLKEEKD